MEREDLKELAGQLAPFLVAAVRDLAHPPHDKYVRGTQAIARFLGISDDTLRRRFKHPVGDPIPVAGSEPHQHKGRTYHRPICLRADLERWVENHKTILARYQPKPTQRKIRRHV